MTDVSDAAIEEITHRSRNLLLSELVALIERYHPGDAPGIDRELPVTYTRALEDESNFTIAPADIDAEIDEALVDTETWVGDGALYVLDGDRISAYPRGWHDRLGGETDVREYVAFLESDESGFASSDPYDEAGIPETTLLEIVPVVGRTDRDAIKAQIEDRRAAGEITEGADQHPDARVQLDRSSS